MKYYLAYGSNLNKTQMGYRCPDAIAVGTATLHGYALVFRRGFLTIEPEEDSMVPVGVWRISDRDEKSLDRYEGFPKFYYKAWFDWKGNGKNRCLVYIMTDGHPIMKPTPNYLLTVAEGYKDFGLDDEPLKRAYYRSISTTIPTTKIG